MSFTAAWAQMLNYIATIAVSAFFVPHYLSVFWEPLRQNPWDIVFGIVVIVVLVIVNIVGIQESARINIFLAVADFATQLLLVAVGAILVLSPSILKANIHLGVAPTWSNFALSIPVAMLAYTGIETVSNMSEEARDPVRTVPRAVMFVAIAVFAIYFTLPWIALSAMPVVHTVRHGYTTLLALPPTERQGSTAIRTTRCSGSSTISGSAASSRTSSRSISGSSRRRSSSSARTRE